MDTADLMTSPDTELSDSELEELQHLALSEGCHDPEEAMRSRTAKVVLKRVSNQVFHITDNEEFNPMVELLRSTYDEFLSKIPITKWEQDTFLSVLQDSKNQQRIKDIVSRLKFAYGRESKTFLTAYMLDQEGDVDPTRLIQYIVDEIENYTLVLDEDEENIQELGRAAGIGIYYTCEEKGDGTEKGKKLILVTEEGKMVRYEYVFKIIKLLNDGLIFGVTATNYWGSENKLTGNIFENKEGVLINIYPESGIVDAKLIVDAKSERNGMIITTGGDGKKGLLKEITPEEENRFVVEGVEEKRKHRKIIELIPAKEDTIELVGDFILTSRTTHTRSSMGNENKINRICIYDEAITYKHIREPYYNLRVLFGSSRDMELTIQGYLLLEDKSTVSFCRYDKEKREFHKIEGLQNIKIPNTNRINDLLDGEITYLEFTDPKENGLCLLDKKTGEFKKLGLVQMKDGTRFSNITVIDDKISLFHSTGNGKRNEHKNLWLQNGELYEFSGSVGKLKLIGHAFSQLFTDKDIDSFSFQSMQPYLRKVDGPIRL